MIKILVDCLVGFVIYDIGKMKYHYGQMFVTKVKAKATIKEENTTVIGEGIRSVDGKLLHHQQEEGKFT